MTVIAYKDGVLAGDGRLADSKAGTILSDSDVKVYRFDDYLFGVAGSAEGAQALIEAMKAGHSGGRLKGTYGLRINQKGVIEIYEGQGWFPSYTKYSAIGVGEQMALVAMDMGASAVEAVRVTCKRNAFCGGKIKKVSF